MCDEKSRRQIKTSLKGGGKMFLGLTWGQWVSLFLAACCLLMAVRQLIKITHGKWQGLKGLLGNFALLVVFALFFAVFGAIFEAGI